MGGEKRRAKSACRARRITARSDPESGTKNPEIAELFDLPNAGIEALATDFGRALGNCDSAS